MRFYEYIIPIRTHNRLQRQDCQDCLSQSPIVALLHCTWSACHLPQPISASQEVVWFHVISTSPTNCEIQWICMSMGYCIPWVPKKLPHFHLQTYPGPPLCWIQVAVQLEKHMCLHDGCNTAGCLLEWGKTCHKLVLMFENKLEHANISTRYVASKNIKVHCVLVLRDKQARWET